MLNPSCPNSGYLSSGFAQTCAPEANLSEQTHVQQRPAPLSLDDVNIDDQRTRRSPKFDNFFQKAFAALGETSSSSHAPELRRHSISRCARRSNSLPSLACDNPSPPTDLHQYAASPAACESPSSDSKRRSKKSGRSSVPDTSDPLTHMRRQMLHQRRMDLLESEGSTSGRFAARKERQRGVTVNGHAALLRLSSESRFVLQGPQTAETSEQDVSTFHMGAESASNQMPLRPSSAPSRRLRRPTSASSAREGLILPDSIRAHSQSSQQCSQSPQHKEQHYKCTICLNDFLLTELCLSIPCGHRCFCIGCEPSLPKHIRDSCPTCRNPTVGIEQPRSR